MKLLTALLAIFILTPLAAQAEDSGDVIVCPAIWACLEDGSVMPEYQGGPCGQRFAAECASQRIASDLSVCEDRRSVESKKAERKIRKLRRELRRLSKR